MNKKNYLQIPKDWEWTKLKEIGIIHTGKTPSKKNGNFYGNEFPFFKPPDLNEGFFIRKSNDNLSYLGTKQTKIIPKRSVLVCCIGATIGKIGFIRIDGATNQQINSIIPNVKIIPEFLYFVCLSSFFQTILKINSSSTTIPIINKNDFSELLIPLPPISEQRKIASYLIDIANLIHNIQAIIIKTKHLKQGLLQQLLTKGIGHTEFKKTSLGRIPKEWEVVELLDILDLLKDGAHNLPKKQISGVPILSAINVDNGNLNFETLFSYISQEDYNKLHKYYKIENGDVLFTCVGSIGRVAIVNTSKKFTLQRSVAIMKPDYNIITSNFLFWLLQSQIMKKQVRQRSKITAQAGIYLGEIGKIKLPIPNIQEQNDISKILDKIRNQIILEENILNKFTLLKKGSMQQLLTGKIRVKV